MLGLNAADSRSFIMVAAVKYGRVSARVNQWPARCMALPAHLAAEQRGTKVVGALEVCPKALQQRDGLLGTTRCHVPGFAHTFGLHPWIADGRE
jgi:hypothetical protein